MKHVSDSDIVAAYTQTGNIWKAGVLLSIHGETVRMRLVKLGINRKQQPLSEADLARIKNRYIEAGDGLVNLAEMSKELGKSKGTLSRKARILGLTKRSRHHSPELIAKQSHLTRMWIRMHGPSHGGRELRVCPTCGRFFDVGKSRKEKYCQRSCVPYLLIHGEAMFSRAKSGKRNDLGGQYFRSRYEANYARYLNFCIEHGVGIQKWEFEADTFEFKTIRKGTRFYTPDFKITYTDGHVEYHEVKGWDYPKGLTARKRMARYYPHIKLFVIDEDFFKALRHQGIQSLIPEWETP